MSIRYDLITGPPTKVLSELEQLVKSNLRGTSSAKVGLTDNPSGRFAQAYKNEYDQMIVFYQTNSIENAREVERVMIDNNWAVLDNEVGGGGGRVGQAPFYVYLVVEKSIADKVLLGAVGAGAFGAAVGGPVGLLVGMILGAIISAEANSN
jgi:hypothetical protein